MCAHLRCQPWTRKNRKTFSGIKINIGKHNVAHVPCASKKHPHCGGLGSIHKLPFGYSIALKSDLNLPKRAQSLSVITKLLLYTGRWGSRGPPRPLGKKMASDTF